MSASFALFLCIVLLWLNETMQKQLISSLGIDFHQSSKYIILQLDSQGLSSRVGAIADWYLVSQEANYTLIISWAPTYDCNISFKNLFQRFPANMIVLNNPLPLGIAGQIYLQQSILGSRNYSFIDYHHKDSFEHAVQYLSWTFSKEKTSLIINKLNYYDADIIHTNILLPIIPSHVPCHFYRTRRSLFYSQLSVTDSIQESVDSIYNSVFQDNMLIAVHLRAHDGVFGDKQRFIPFSKNMNTGMWEDSNSSPFQQMLGANISLNHYIQLVYTLWQYYKYEIELTSNTVVESETEVDYESLVAILGDNVVNIANDGRSIIVRKLLTTKVLEIRSWARFLVSSNDNDIISRFLHLVEEKQYFGSSNSWMTVLAHTTTGNDKTLVIIEDIKITKETISPIVVLQDTKSRNDPHGMRLAMIEWTLISRAIMIIETFGSHFAHEAAFAAGLSPSSYILPSSTTSGWVKSAASLREIPVLYVLPNNVTLYEDSSQQQCGDPMIAFVRKLQRNSSWINSASAFEEMYHICPPLSLPWHLDGATHNIYCLT